MTKTILLGLTLGVIAAMMITSAVVGSYAEAKTKEETAQKLREKATAADEAGKPDKVARKLTDRAIKLESEAVPPNPQQ